MIFHPSKSANAMARFATGALTAFLALTPIACGDLEQDIPAGSGEAEGQLFSFRGTTLWNNASGTNQGALGRNAVIPICFAVRPTTRCPNQTSANVDCEGLSTNAATGATLNGNALRTAIRGLVENTWVRAANVEFVNWGDCAINPSTNTHVDAQLANTMVVQFQQVFDPPANKACTTNSDCSATPRAVCSNKICTAGSVDFSGLGKSSSGPTVIQFNWPAIQSGNNNFNLIHEIGHALGFAHEWERDGFTDARCTAAEKGKIKDGLSLSPFPDPASIMNYCGINRSTNDRLSAGDVVGMQRAYGRKSSGSLVSFGGMCADIAGAFTALGTAVIPYPCRNAPNDRWFRDPNSQRLQATLAGGQARCLNVSGGSVSSTSPTPVISWSCVPDANEQFKFVDVEWRGMGNQCATASGTAVVMRACDGTREQKWTFLDGDPNTSLAFNQIRSTSSGLCASMTTATGGMGERVALRSCSSSDAKQRFSFPGQGIIGFGNLCMNVLGGIPTGSREVGLWDGCAGTPKPFNSQFSVFGNVRSLGQCLDSSNASQVQVSTCSSGNTAQSWEFYL